MVHDRATGRRYIEQVLYQPDGEAGIHPYAQAAE